MTRHPTLIVTVESIGTVQQRTRDAFEQELDDNTSAEDTPRRLSFETTDQLAQVFTPRAIDLLQAMADHGPGVFVRPPDWSTGTSSKYPGI